ncbi:uncharacterized protein LOC110225850 isoform X2 [Arabidopsis lyrata subsp. lyrata]|uniref:uncharacterized protein LOC110225850 isoform X2 n=1 Tax=Arabidopsis lyrata subsp. lyrata TaxID=81972 RepID=UPI000A29AB55|nr:uncharacterized protein LOC110225850 isoform X2 [Arabidopsis lyrata subsp. lyrata]|eukprot:XP_020871629.1 uncharacterized protein LOC110225850 isoform X2 [Arabidopsis lyrata subsp. lyrata]
MSKKKTSKSKINIDPVDMKQHQNRRGNNMDTKPAAYVSGSAHSPAKTPTGIDLIPNPSLPRRLLPSAGLPDRARLNIYCKPKYLGILVQLLKGSETWSSFLASQFWKLFELHVARCFHSAKLIQEPQAVLDLEEVESCSNCDC